MNTGLTQVEHQPASTSSFLGLTRFFWTLLGPLLLLGAIAQNVARPAGWFSLWDAVVALIVAAMIGCRWREQRRGGAKTAYGDPSTPQHFRLYVTILLVVAAVAWVLANVLGNHFLI